VDEDFNRMNSCTMTKGCVSAATTGGAATSLVFLTSVLGSNLAVLNGNNKTHSNGNGNCAVVSQHDSDRSSGYLPVSPAVFGGDTDSEVSSVEGDSDSVEELCSDAGVQSCDADPDFYDLNDDMEFDPSWIFEVCGVSDVSDTSASAFSTFGNLL
jgi:hypothetical protein